MAISMNTKVTLPKFTLREFSAPSGPRSPAERLWLVGGVVAGLLLLLVGYLALIAPQRSDTDAVRQQVSDAQTQQAALTSRIAVLRSQNKNLPRYLAELKTAQEALPTDSGVPALLRELQTAAAATSVSVATTTVGVPTAVTAAAPAAAGAGSTAAPASGNGAASDSTSTAAPTPTGAYSMTVSLTVNGSPGNLDQFLVQLQRSVPRAMLITQLSESGGTAGSSTSTLSLSMLAFMMPKAGTAPTAAATP